MPESPQSADVVIIGAGIVGASVAYHLCRHTDLRVVCFEQEGVAAGSTSRSAAAFRHQFSSRINVEMSLWSGRAYREFPEVMGCEPVFAQQGYLFLYSDPADVEAASRRAALQREYGVENVQLLDGAQACGLFEGTFEPAQIAGATWCPGDGFLHPTTIAQTYYERAKEHGLISRIGARATEIERQNGRVSGVVLADGSRIETPVVINTAGWWGNEVARMAGVEIPLVAVKRYLYLTNQLDPRKVSHFPMTVFDLGPYYRPESNGLLLGSDERPKKPAGWKDFPPPAQDFEALREEQDAVPPEFGKGMDGYGIEVLASIAEFVPFFEEEVAIESIVCGYYEITPDEKALIGWDPRVDGLLHATGFSGHGVMHAPATGEIVRCIVTGEEPPFDISALKIDPLLRNEQRDDPEVMVI
ncbi:MAG: FAD-binding oxidoreductase [Planctomycetota bacterium]